MPVVIAVLAYAAELVVKNYQDKKEAAELAAKIGGLLKENNVVLVGEIADLIKQQFSMSKLQESLNKLDSLIVFIQEYVNDTSDSNKLATIDQQSQFVIDTLNDDDIRLAGLGSFVVAADLRIAALKAKSLTFSGDLLNAKQRAADYAAYCEASIPLIHESVTARIGPTFHYQTLITPDQPTRYEYRYMIDPDHTGPLHPPPYGFFSTGPGGDSQNEAIAVCETYRQQDMAELIQNVENDFLSGVRAHIDIWKQFASS